MDAPKLLGRKRGKWFDYYIEVLGGSVESFMALYPPGYQRTKLRKAIEKDKRYQYWLRDCSGNDTTTTKTPRSIIRDNLKGEAQARGVEIEVPVALRKKVKSKKKVTKVKNVKNVKKLTVKAKKPLSRITKPVAVEIYKKFKKLAFEISDSYGIDVTFPKATGKLDYGPLQVFSAVISVKPEIKNLDDPACWSDQEEDQQE